MAGSCTGTSAGLAPLRILSTYIAAPRYLSGRLGRYAMSAPASANSRNCDTTGRFGPRASSRMGPRSAAIAAPSITTSAVMRRLIA